MGSKMELPLRSFILLCLLSSSVNSSELKQSGDGEALLALKAAVDPMGSLPWRREAIGEMCRGWKGVKGCFPNGRLTKLVLEFLNLTGPLPPDILTPFGELRVLSFKSNALSGAIPDLSSLPNLKSLYLNDNRFSGAITPSFAGLHRLKIIVLAGNLLSGPIPPPLADLPRLYALQLQDNHLTGPIPAFNQPSLQFLNVSNNALSGEIPATRALSQFDLSSFLNNSHLCGELIQVPCSQNPTFPPSMSPQPSSSSIVASPPPASKKKSSKKKVIAIAVGSAGGALFFFLFFFMAIGALAKRRKKSMDSRTGNRGVVVGPGNNKAAIEGGEEEAGAGGKDGGAFKWEGEEVGRLKFVGGAGEMYGLEDLLRASAETLGRGTMGSTYKAVMETGFIVTVKRLKESSWPSVDEFRRRIEELGQLRHPNLVPLRAYFQAKEERLLVYDYFPNGSLFSLVHGSRPSGNGKPLHWTSCLKIAEDIATGLLYIHQSSPGMVHGNLKSSNVLLGPDFESCVTDYGLLPYFRCSDSGVEDTPSAASLFYRAPESRHPHKSFTQQSDVYSFGVLLLELLTGKTPFQDLVTEHGEDIARWVKAVREEETTESGEDPASGNEGSEEKLAALVNIAMACVSVSPEGRPGTKEVVKMVKDARAEAMVSSNSSEHSPGRWSDTVHSLPRDKYRSEHLNFAERD